MVYQVASSDELKAKLEEAGDKLVVIDFFAPWCGPCKMIAPQIENLAKEKPDVIFLKVDVDDNEEIASEYNVSSMPTFVFIKNGKTLHAFAGANLDKVKQGIEKYQ